MLKLLLFPLLLVCTTVCSWGQSENAEFRILENTLIELRNKTLKASNEKERIHENANFIQQLEKALSKEESFHYGFDSIPSSGKLYAPDEKFRMITWNLPLDNGSHVYYCFLQVKVKKEYFVYQLNDQSEHLKRVSNKVLPPKKWYGALYYDIIKVKKNGRKYYTLLGWDGFDQFTTKKVIDVVYFNSSGNPKFGAPIFKLPRKTVRRVFFEYSDQATMTLKYEEKRKQIVFDHLAPTKEELKGVRQYYVPDLTFDAFQLEKGNWKFIPDIDIRLKDNKPFNYPPPPDLKAY